VTITTEQALKEFTEAMKLTLDEHQNKKGDSWNCCDLRFLENKLIEEINEYHEEKKPLAKAEELVDIANICMMLYIRHIDIWSDKVKRFLDKKADEFG
jgi:hypothetical protein